MRSTGSLASADNFGVLALNRRNRDGLLAGVATDLLQFNDPERLLGSVFERISSQTVVDLCFCHFQPGNELQLSFVGGLRDELRSELGTSGLREAADEIAVCTSGFLKYEHISESKGHATAFLRRAGMDAFCCFPLLSGGKLVGTLSFGTGKSPVFTMKDLELQRTIADQVAIAFDRILLIRELARNNQKLLEANAQTMRAHAELEQIAFSASHDLREPVRHLNLYTELLLQHLTGPVDDQAARYLQFISSNAKRVELLVSDLLEYTGVGHEEPASREIDTSGVAERVCAKLRALIEETETTVHLQPLPTAHIAEDDLFAIFENLIENAILHRSPGVAPFIQVFALSRDDHPIYCVLDNGGGIDREHQEKIFGLFRQLHAEERSNATGLGLTLCRKIVERYNGEIWVESELGQGALFCFTLNRKTNVRKSFAAHSGISR